MTSKNSVDFDKFCDDYEKILDNDLKISGENLDYFIRFKTLWIKNFLTKTQRMQGKINVLDVGCGLGGLNKHISNYMPGASYYGIDISQKSTQKASRQNSGLKNSHYCNFDGISIPFRQNTFQIVILSQVLHHVLPDDRRNIIREISRVLRPDGYLFIFEHNKYNPIVQYVVKKCVIDTDANLLALGTVKKELTKSDFKAVKCDYVIFFPGFLKKLRFLEKWLSWLPLGAQYVIAGRKYKMRNMTASLYELYSRSRLSVRLYSRMRWALCPFEEIEELIPEKAYVVDVGCGFGLLANYIALMSEGRKVLGIDFSTTRIGTAKSTAGTRRNISFMTGNVKDLCLSECDVVVMTDFLHHISFDCQYQLLKEVNSKLKIGGKLILQDADAGRRWKYSVSLLLDAFLNIGKPLFYRNKKSWYALLEQAGLTVTQFYSIDKFFLPDIIFVCEKKQARP